MRFLLFICLLIFTASVKGQVNDSIPSSDKVSESNKYTSKGQKEEEKGEYNKAIKHYIKAVELRLDYFEALPNRSMPNTDIQNYREALSAIKSILKVDSNRTDLRVNLKIILNDLVVVKPNSNEEAYVNASSVITTKEMRRSYHSMKKGGLIMMFSGAIIGVTGFALAKYYYGMVALGNPNPSLAGVLPGAGSSPYYGEYYGPRAEASSIACGIGVVDLLLGTALFIDGYKNEKKLNNRLTFTPLPNGIRIAYTF